MDTNYTSAKPLRTRLLYFFCALFGFFITGATAYVSIKDEHINLIFLLIGLMFALAGIFCLKAAIKIKRIKVDDDGVELLSYGGLTIQRLDFNDIDTCVITNKGQHRVSARKMILTSKDGVTLVIDFSMLNSAFSEGFSAAMRNASKRAVDENNYYPDPDRKRTKKKRLLKLIRVNNFRDLYTFLTQTITEKVGIKIEYKYSKSWIALAILIGLFATWLIHYGVQSIKPYEPLAVSEFVKINGTLTQKLKIDRERSSRRSAYYNSIDITFKEYPKIVFEMERLNYPKRAQQLINSTNAGDTLTLTIDKNFYEKKILKTKQFSFTEKYIITPRPKVVGLRHKDEIYFSFRDYNARAMLKHGDDKWSVFIFGVLLVMLDIYIIYQGIKQSKTK